MKNLIVRTISGIIYVALISVAILCGPYSFAAIFGAITCLALWEFYRLLEKTTGIHVDKPVAILGGLYLFLAGFLNFAGIWPITFLSLWFLFMLYLLIRELYVTKNNPLHNIAYTFLGQVYIVLPLIFLGKLGYIDELYSPVYLMSFFVLIWIYDTGAFLVGSTFGKHRLMERISPKKSIEGLIGGLILSLITSIVISVLFPNQLTLIQWLGFALVTVIFGTWGDLVESMFKRSLNVKDSGNMIPGHGGMLDRIDSCLLAAPAVVIYFLFVL